MKKLTICIMLLAILAFAGIEGDFTQFTREDLHEEARPDQNWLGARMLYMHVTAGSAVWLTNYVDHFDTSAYWDGDDYVTDLGKIYDMGIDNKFGYILKSDFGGNNSIELSEYDANNITIHYSTSGETREITYTDADSKYKVKTMAYLLGEFDSDADIYLVMTALPSEGGATMDTYQYVDDDPKQGHDSTDLISRVYKTDDLAGNIRINLGYHGFVDGHEFVAVYASVQPQTTGQPLPGVLLAGLLSVGSIVSCKKLRRRR